MSTEAPAKSPGWSGAHALLVVALWRSALGKR
jgi:hypothetical protein